MDSQQLVSVVFESQAPAKGPAKGPGKGPGKGPPKGKGKSPAAEATPFSEKKRSSYVRESMF